MTVSRVLPFALMLVILPLGANAQFGGMPGMPGAPGGMPGMPGGGFGAPQQGPPPVCQKLLHSKASETAKYICEAAARGTKPTGPRLLDALGSTPTVPDATTSRGGTFDTLMGSPLAR